MTALNGTLERRADGWHWSDGTPAPEVSDLSASSYYNFRCTRFSDQTFVEVPITTARREPELQWIWEGYQSRQFRETLSGDHRGLKVLQIDEQYADGDVPGISQPGLAISASYARADGSTRAIPRVALVPVNVWDEWCDANPIGATWDKAAENQIFSKARAMGWEDSV